MKSKLLLLIVSIIVLFQQKAVAQVPEIASDDLNLEYSTGEKSVWYAISSAKTGSSNECITDVSDVKISIEAFDSKKENQLWKLVQSDSEVNFVNKATGKVIQTQSDVFANSLMHNYTQLAENATSGKGWTLNHLSAGQYSISGVEEDNIIRYLNAAEEGNNPDKLDNAALINSGFAWKFTKITPETSSVPVIKNNDYRIYSVNRRIVVEGSLDYTVKTIQGMSVSKNTELPVGIYIVIINGNATKLLVK